LPIKTAHSRVNGYFVHQQDKAIRANLTKTASVFFLTFFVLFIGMTLCPNIYDEGLILTGAMRVAAGQIPHRDFYANYGPGQFYTIAALFKLFGESILVERLYDLFIRALLVTFTYAIISSYCRRSISIWISVATILWLLGFNHVAGTPLMPVLLLNLVASILILPVFSRPISTKRMLAAGAVAGMAALFRYDTGIALLGIHACVIAIAVSFQMSGISNRLRAFASTFWSYLLGFAAVTLPALLYYLSVSPLYPFVHDIILYPSKYYYRGRNLPFPGIPLSALENIGVYLPIAIVGIALYMVVVRRLRGSGENASNPQSIPEEQKWHGFLVTFGLLTLVMYFKGLVRVSVIHMSLSIIPSLILIAVLFQHRLTLSRPVRISITVLLWLSVFAAGCSALREVRTVRHEPASVPKDILLSARHSFPEMQVTWCKIENPLTRGFCFFPDDDHIQAIEFIESHTRSDQKLFVGQTRHDIVFANDNLTYFATQRLPATKWSHFDPGLQNSYEIQTQMVHDLEVNTPPYIVLDSELDLIREPNDSSKSSGVTLLDEYIHNKYQHVKTFGEMSIFQRIHIP
jgi:hypothetical protein